MKPATIPPRLPWPFINRARKFVSWSTYRSDLHGNTNTPLYRSTDVVAVPRRDVRNVGKYSKQNKEGSEVFDSVIRHGDENNEADHPFIQSALIIICSKKTASQYRGARKTYAIQAMPMTKTPRVRYLSETKPARTVAAHART
jgi:hypothetical protein